MKQELERFLQAQEDSYEKALRELKNGKKTSHWMWYIFPQIRGLGKSRMSFFYGIANLDEARAYLEHPILGQRLIACCDALLTHKDKTAVKILGEIDAMKLRSSLTLFAIVSEENSIIHKVLKQFYDGQCDTLTLELAGGGMKVGKNL